MRQRSPIVAVAGLLAVLLRPAAVQAQAARPVPPPTVTIPPSTGTPSTGTGTSGYAVEPAPAEALPVTSAETVPTPPPATTSSPSSATPAPTPYAGPDATAPLTAPPGASTPTPYATPGVPPVKPTGFDFGGQSLAPLPPPPPAIDPATIRRQPWRGRYWMAFRLSITGPVAGEHPAAPSVLALGGGADFGWRVGNVLGLGMGLSGQTHNLQLVDVTNPGTGERSKQTFKSQMLYWDALFARFHLPLKRRFQPYAEVGFGLARLLSRGDETRSYGPQVRASLGLEGWVSSNVTLGIAGTYRLNALNHPSGHSGWVIGHAMQGTFELGFHW